MWRREHGLHCLLTGGAGQGRWCDLCDDAHVAAAVVNQGLTVPPGCAGSKRCRERSCWSWTWASTRWVNAGQQPAATAAGPEQGMLRLSPLTGAPAGGGGAAMPNAHWTDATDWIERTRGPTPDCCHCPGHLLADPQPDRWHGRSRSSNGSARPGPLTRLETRQHASPPGALAQHNFGPDVEVHWRPAAGHRPCSRCGACCHVQTAAARHTRIVL